MRGPTHSCMLTRHVYPGIAAKASRSVSMCWNPHRRTSHRKSSVRLESTSIAALASVDRPTRAFVWRVAPAWYKRSFSKLCTDSAARGLAGRPRTLKTASEAVGAYFSRRQAKSDRQASGASFFPKMGLSAIPLGDHWQQRDRAPRRQCTCRRARSFVRPAMTDAWQDMSWS